MTCDVCNATDRVLVPHTDWSGLVCMMCVDCVKVQAGR